MEGHIRKRGKKWCYIVDVGTDANGKRKQKWFTLKSTTKKEAQADALDILMDLKKGKYIPKRDLTVNDILDKWLYDHARLHVEETTYEGYESAANKIRPYLGNTKVTESRPDIFQEAFNKMAENETERNTKYAYKVLSMAFNRAIMWELVDKNPCKSITPPKYTRGKILVYTPEQIVYLLESTKGTNMFLPIVLASTCGLRRGEIAALLWEHIDDENRLLRINDSRVRTQSGKVYTKGTKTDPGKRPIALPMESIKALEAQKEWQNNNREDLNGDSEDKLYFESDYICTYSNGEPLKPDYITKTHKKILKRLGLPHIKFHELRHSHASVLMYLGESIKAVQERLGHSRPQMSYEYTQVLPNLQRSAADKIDSIFIKKSEC